jgi:hypothetical protein
MKVISYSLYGDNQMYCAGAIRNAEIVREKYPDWKCLIWFDSSVPSETIESLAKFENVLLIDMTGSLIPGMYWRFLCLDVPDIEVFCVRDADSRITDREVSAVEDWLKKDKTLHLMRDHPHHNYPVMGGMWGFRNDRSRWRITDRLNYWISNQRKTFAKMDDMDFISHIYSDYQEDCVVHDDWMRCKNSVPFPTARADKRFVGEIYLADESTTDHWRLL